METRNQRIRDSEGLLEPDRKRSFIAVFLLAGTSNILKAKAEL
jgi:hypothetical protein